MRRKRIDFNHLDIPSKANRVLHFILIGIILILVRVWHLSVIQYDQKVEESRKPQRRTVVEPAVRATIRDRFNLPLAQNKISYQATILYSSLKDIPSTTWKVNEEGKKVRVFKRKEYIRNLSKVLAEHLNLDVERLEDLIHSKASYYSQVPFVIKEDLAENEYYKLKMLEKDWPGIHMRRLSRREYPRGRVAADVIGYMGPINRKEYEKILHEMKALEEAIQKSENGEEVEFPGKLVSVEDARRRLRNLEAKAYTIHDYIGKTGIEGVYEELLRGFYGKKVFYSDSKGKHLKELPGSRPVIAGHRVLLTLSAELQEYAEKLLAQNESLRQVKNSRLGDQKKTKLADKEPWIKGGAIVVMEPFTGEILTLASYPRFDPNDFIIRGDPDEQNEKRKNIHRWFENEVYLKNIWNLQQPLERERFDELTQTFYDESVYLNWKAYLSFILPPESAVYQTMTWKVFSIKDALAIQREISQLMEWAPNQNLYALLNMLYQDEDHVSYPKPLKASDKAILQKLFDEHKDGIKQIKQNLQPYLAAAPNQYDKGLIVDLCRLIVSDQVFSSELIKTKGDTSLEAYHEQCGSLVTLFDFLKQMLKELYHDEDFARWKTENQTTFLKEKRIEEKTIKTYPKPYLDYLDQREELLFRQFWQAYRLDFLILFLTGEANNQPVLNESTKDLTPYIKSLLHWHEEIEMGAYQVAPWKVAYSKLQKAIYGLTPSEAELYLRSMRSFDELNRPLLGKYRYLRSGNPSLEKHLAMAFYPRYGFGYGRSYAYRQSSIQGSLFKLVTAYEALIQQFKKMGKKVTLASELNPLIIVDEVFQKGQIRYVGYTEDGKPIPQLYKGGRLPRSLAHQHNGKVDLIRALEVSSNPYFSLLAGECLENPDDLSRAARLFSFGSKTGIDLPAEIAGAVPNDLSTNRTGLYAMAIGQHSLVVTPLQTAVMLAAIANGGKILKPKIVKLTAGKEPHKDDDQIICLPHFDFQTPLSLVGIDFPLFNKSSLVGGKGLIKVTPTVVRHEIFMPAIVRQILLKGLQAASIRTYQDNLRSLSHLYREDPDAIRDFTSLKNQLFGKTSTSESVENIDLDLNDGTNIYTHVWFGCIAFEKDEKLSNQALLLMKDEFGKPELVVVVYLPYGGYGKEAAPLAAQMVKKWREIKQKYE